MKKSTCAVLCAFFCALAEVAASQNYPTRPVRLISPYPPGGGSDAVARILVQALTEKLGQQFIVDSRGGASGKIASELTARAAPDGHTLLLGNLSPQAILPAASSKLPYDPIKDFTPIGIVATADYILALHPSVPVKSLHELIALAKTAPGKFTFASSGNLGAPHLAGELLNLLSGIKLVHVPYKGTGPAAVGVLTGESMMMFGSAPSIMPHAAARRLNIVATTGARRSLPDTPTFSELIPDYVMTQWYGLLGPAGLPGKLVGQLNVESVKLNASPAVLKAYAAVGVVAANNTPDEFGVFIKNEISRWGKVIKAANLKVE